MDDIDFKEGQRQEWLQDQRHEELMRTDYDYVLDHIEDEFETIRESYNRIQKVLVANGWDCSQYNILEEIKERL
jgi:urate oxidase